MQKQKQTTKESFKRILLINPEREFLPPLGLLYIGAVLEKNRKNVKVIEFLNTKINEEENVKENYKIFRESIRYSPDIIGILCMSSQIVSVKNLIKRYKRELPKIPIVIGGPYAKADPLDLLNSNADFIVLREGEKTFPELIEYMQGKRELEDVKGIAFKRDGNFVITKEESHIQNLDSLPFPAYHLIDYNHYINLRFFGIRGLWLKCGGIITSRGCPGRCIFCSCKLVHGRNVRYRSIKNVIEEIEFLVNKYKIDGFWIMDDTFTLSEKRVIEFCNRLMEKNLRLKWSCQTRANTFTERMARAMRDAGCVQVEFGVESGSQKVLDILKKDIKINQIKQSFKICHKNGIRPFATIMIGSPGETIEDIQLTRELIKEIKPAHTGYYFTTPHPGTELYDLAIKNKWINPKKNIWWIQTEDPTMCINFTKEELIEIRNSLYEDTLNKSLFNLLKSPSFLYYLSKQSIKNPSFLLNMIRLLSKRKNNEAINLFRKQILLNSPS